MRFVKLFSTEMHARLRLEAELRTAPVTTLVVVADLGIGFVAEPMRYLAVLTRLPRKLLLDEE